MSIPDSAYWSECIRAFLHDPPDKALDIKGHEERAVRYQAAALNIPTDEARARAQKEGDWLASALERLPLPKGSLEVDCNRLPRHQLRRTHPVSGADITNLTSGLSTAQDVTGATVDRRVEVIRALCQQQGDERQRAYALWRYLPTILPKVAELPGDTRLTDHSIIDHLDAGTAATSALKGDEAAILTFSLGPVQDFIGQARSLRDLWTGSYLIAWLTFHAMVPVIERCGPWCVVSPGLRGSPFCDWWLGRQGVRTPNGALTEAALADLRCASIPNVFTALIPAQQGAAIADAVRAAVTTEWKRIAGSVHGALEKAWGTGWDAHWDEQVAEVWDIRTVVLPFAKAGTSDQVGASADHLRTLFQDLLGELPASVVSATTIAERLKANDQLPGYVRSQGMWALANELAQKVLEADKRQRRIPAHAASDDTREKCALMPGFAVMGPVGSTADNKAWWTQAVANAPRLAGKLSSNERLSAPGLIKRFAFGAYFRKELGRDEFPDTREAALASWLSDFRRLVKDNGKATGGLHWDNFVKTVEGINRRTDFAGDETWAAHELLDESRLDWTQWRDLSQDHKALKDNLQRAKKARAELLVRAKEVALPPPPTYVAVLVADGDRMGEFLRGTRGPTFAQSYHPEVVKHLQSLPGAKLETHLKTVRPFGPAGQIAFSRCLGDFTAAATRLLAQEGKGTIVYAGGDDLLALLPVSTCLVTANEIAREFGIYVAGATISAGLAVVHVQEDLRVAIQAARGAEATAKRLGRDGLCLRIVRRSGETTESYCPWSTATGSQRLVASQTADEATWDWLARRLTGISDRWVHHLLEEEETLSALPLSAVHLRIAHLIRHSDAGDRLPPGDVAGEMWEAFLHAHGTRHDAAGKALLSQEQVIHHFIAWCQSVAWLSRYYRREELAAKAAKVSP